MGLPGVPGVAALAESTAFEVMAPIGDAGVGEARSSKPICRKAHSTRPVSRYCLHRHQSRGTKDSRDRNAPANTSPRRKSFVRYRLRYVVVWLRWPTQPAYERGDG